MLAQKALQEEVVHALKTDKKFMKESALHDHNT
jgi:hypothetical protein